MPLPRYVAVTTVTLTVAMLGAAGCAEPSSSRPAASEAVDTDAPAAPLDRPYVTGEGAPADDWDDEGLLGENLPIRSDLAALWQTVLWADGYLERDAIDCRYAGATVRATRTWQSNRGLGADGIVGPLTFGRAGEQLVERGEEVHYTGTEHTVPFRRAEDGRYLVADAGSHRPLRRDRATLDVCADAADR
ncbi:peptidoglycan-binding domain-containing protein [Streptomyces sp. TRM70308]|uniref:peptidoglycan-binding domain-containing protein n=1 Tax=Streptomyces sp. TRM70308 TaxID=3131932 RepID=UPI003CFBDB2B